MVERLSVVRFLRVLLRAFLTAVLLISFMQLAARGEREGPWAANAEVGWFSWSHFLWARGVQAGPRGVFFLADAAATSWSVWTHMVCCWACLGLVVLGHESRVVRKREVSADRRACCCFGRKHTQQFSYSHRSSVCDSLGWFAMATR